MLTYIMMNINIIVPVCKLFKKSLPFLRTCFCQLSLNICNTYFNSILASKVNGTPFGWTVTTCTSDYDCSGGTDDKNIFY